MSGGETEKPKGEFSLADFRRLMDSPTTMVVPTVTDPQQGQRRRLDQLQQEDQRKRKKFISLVEADLDPVGQRQRSRKLLSRLK